MATKKAEEKQETMNIYEKLTCVRNEFYAEGAKKSGLNLHAEFKYFELEDIVPIAEPLFAKYKLFMLPTFSQDMTTARVINTEDSSEEIYFEIPLKSIAEPSKFRMNEIQAMGAAVTYYRRYLYMLILDLVESDEIDGGIVQKKPEVKKPVTPQERESIKENLTNTDAPADSLLIDGLKAVCKKLMDTDPTQENFVQEIAVKTDGFKTVTKKQCEQLIDGINQMINAYNEVQ